MQIIRISLGVNFFLLLLLLGSCGPKSVTTDPVLLKESSKSWIPYAGEEQVTFYFDTDTVVFTGHGRVNYFDNVRYMTDQSGFFSSQEDYYADLEREELLLTSDSMVYFMQYCLEKGKGESGEWDIIRVKIADGNYYSNDMKIVIFQTDSFDKGEVYQFKDKVTLNGNDYLDVYYTTQERRPFELYYTRDRGIVAFKLSSNEIWTIDPDNLN
jgi:hypothetical protein